MTGALLDSGHRVTPTGGVMSADSPGAAGAAPRAAAEPLHGRELSASLTVKDLRGSVAWYRDVLRFEVDREHEREGRLIAVSLRADRKSTRLNSSHVKISYAVLCLKKKMPLP